jgi:glycosyltransferase involved in cell wall biosynthesis
MAAQCNSGQLRTPMKRVYVNGRFLTQRVTGVQRYALETLRAMDTLLSSGAGPRDLDLELLAPRGTTFPRLDAIRTRSVGRLRGHAWEQLSLPAAVGSDWLLSFGPTGPLLKRDQIVTIHDAGVCAVPDSYSWRFRTFQRLLLPLLVRRNRYLMTVSEFSKGELIRWFGARPESTRVSGEGWQHLHAEAADASVLAQHGLEAGRYVLAVSSVTPHKNFQVVAQALRLLQRRDVQVAVVGSMNADIFGDFDSSRLAGLKFLGRVNDAQLRALYEGAAVFVHPSLYEGFGIPPLEAMALGCTVIASDAAALPEVCGEAALYFSPHDASGLAASIERALSEPGLRAALREKARSQLAKHSWTAAAANHLGLLQEAHGLVAGQAGVDGDLRGHHQSG